MRPLVEKRVTDVRLRTPAPESEFSVQFLQGMLNRMAVSYFKYGAVSEGYPEKVSALGSLQQRVEKYAATGNTEYLIDAANFAMIEFMCPSKDDARFLPTDSDGSPGRVSRAGTVDDSRNEDIKVPEKLENMKVDVTPQQVVAEIASYRETHGFSPSIRDLQKTFGLKSTSTTLALLERARRMGQVSWTPGVARSFLLP